MKGLSRFIGDAVLPPLKLSRNGNTAAEEQLARSPD
jgi:hypothetical protein